MEQISERRDQISKYMQPYTEECFQKSCDSIQTELDFYASGIQKGLKCCMNECLNHVGTMQQQQSKGKLQYLVFNFWQCGIYFDEGMKDFL